jgi:hypothetical protein
VNKDITHRIFFYTKKVAERMSIYPSKALPAAYTYRSQRLSLYKKLMDERIALMGWRVWQS